MTSREEKVKAEFGKVLNSMGRYFMEDQDALNLIGALKKKVDSLQLLDQLYIEEKGNNNELPLPSDYKKAENSFALFSDGACRGNPGPGSWGAIGQNNVGEVVFEAAGVDTSTTNNRMELMGAIEGLKSIEDHIISILTPRTPSEFSIDLYSDSKYVVDGMSSWVAGWKKRGWKKADKKVPENIELWKELDELTSKFWTVNYKWVKGHSGHPQNEYCDQIANKALDDSGF